MGMQLTTDQVAQKLGVKRQVVIRLVKTGKLVPTNKPEDGKRVEFRYDPAVVREFKKTYVPVRRTSRKGGLVADGPGVIRQQIADLLTQQAEVMAKLDTIATAIAQLIKMWS